MFRTSRKHCTESPVVTSFSKDYSVGAAVGYSFVVEDDDSKGIVCTRTTYLTSQKLYFWIHGGDFV